MAGVVGIAANDSSRFTLFTMSLTSLQSPVNTTIEWGVGSDRSVGRNNVVKAALARGAEWVLFLDDDHAFRGDVLTRLLADDKDIVGALYVQRTMPFAPIAYTSWDADTGLYTPLQLNDYAADDVVEVVGLGTGGMLIRAEVFHALSEFEGNWFTHTTEQSEDLTFCQRARQAGFEVYVDLGVRMAHIAPATVTPGWNPREERWEIGWVFSESAHMSAPIAT